MTLEDHLLLRSKASAYVMGAFFIFYGAYCIFFWPKRLRKAIADGKTSPQHEKRLSWTAAAGVCLIIVGVTQIALALAGVI